MTEIAQAASELIGARKVHVNQYCEILHTCVKYHIWIILQIKCGAVQYKYNIFPIPYIYGTA